jgi:hypothetical protein
MMTQAGQSDFRIIFAHKHGTSARTRFLCFAEGSVCGFSPLPELSQLLDTTKRPAVATHPASLINQAAMRFRLPAGAIEWEPEFNLWVDIPGGPIRVLLFRFTDIDPPFASAEGIGGRFIDLTEARGLPNVELLLLRRAYEVLLGG